MAEISRQTFAANWHNQSLFFTFFCLFVCLYLNFNADRNLNENRQVCKFAFDFYFYESPSQIQFVC